MMHRWWDRLSSTELRARLEQRGVPPLVAGLLVQRRDVDPRVRAEITRQLSR